MTAVVNLRITRPNRAISVLIHLYKDLSPDRCRPSLAAFGFLQIERKSKSIPKKVLLVQSREARQVKHRVTTLEMRIEDHLCHRQHATRLEGRGDLSQCCFPIRNLT